VLGGEIGIEDFLHVLTDAQGIEHLQIREAIEKQDAVHELVRVVHLLDRFLAPLFREIFVAPVVEHPVVQPILVDCGQFRSETAVQVLDDFRIALHGFLAGASVENQIWNYSKKMSSAGLNGASARVP
jgi:hypothetical protein